MTLPNQDCDHTIGVEDYGYEGLALLVASEWSSHYTNWTGFRFCPDCGEKIDWEAFACDAV